MSEEKTLWQRLTDWDRSPIYHYFILRQYIHELKDKDALFRRIAAMGLEDLAEDRPDYNYKAAVPALIEAMNDDDKNVRSHADTALAKIGKPAVHALVKALGDENPHARGGALYALICIGTPAVPALIEVLKNREGQRVRHLAAAVLGEIGDPAVPVLIEALKDKSKDVRGYAAEALEICFKNYQTAGQLSEFQKKLEGFMKNLLKEYGRIIDVPPDIQFKVGNLMIETAKRKNSLASDKGILLDDIPKPPKENKLYQQLSQIPRNIKQLR